MMMDYKKPSIQKQDVQKPTVLKKFLWIVNTCSYTKSILSHTHTFRVTTIITLHVLVIITHTPSQADLPRVHMLGKKNASFIIITMQAERNYCPVQQTWGEVLCKVLKYKSKYFICLLKYKYKYMFQLCEIFKYKYNYMYHGMYLSTNTSTIIST